MRGRAGRGRKSGPSTVTIPVQATSPAAISANQFTGWTHSAGVVVSRSLYGTTSNYFYTTDSTTVATQSKAISRDQELNFWASDGRVYLRMTDDGRALRFETKVFAGGGGPPDGGGWEVQFVVVGSSGYSSDQQIALLGEGVPTGVDTGDTAGDEWTFGVEGFDVYVKWNGVEQWRTKQIYCIKPGRIGLRSSPNTAEHGFRQVSATFKASTAVYSTPEFGILDVRDFGVVNYATTGSMTGGSTTLTVASNPGFAIGDPVIVEIGGESGAGARGTRGVGGQWPTLTYANATAMNADTSQATNKMCALIDTGVVYQWDGDSWNVYATSGFFDLMLPKALLATITNVSGTTITLDTAATVSTTNANVYFNAGAKYEEELVDPYVLTYDAIPDLTVEFPAQHFAWGVYNASTGFGDNRTRWNVRGLGQASTRIFSPEGTASLSLGVTVWQGPSVISDMELVGNARADGGYQAFYDASDVPTQSGPCNIGVSNSGQVAIRDIKTVDHYQSGIVLSACSQSTVDDCLVEHTTGHRGYTQWGLNFANCENCTADSITIDSDYFMAGFEQFQCTGCTFSNITGRNTFCAVNSSDEWTYIGITITLETGALDASYFDWASNLTPVVNINSNIDNQQGNEGGSQNGVFENFYIVQETDFRSGVVFGMMSFSGTVDYVTIRGEFPNKPNTLGLLEMPTYSSTGAKGINDDSTSKYITIDGVRVLGSNSGGPDIRMNSSNSIVRNSVADTISCNGTTSSNIDNAAYDAL